VFETEILPTTLRSLYVRESYRIIASSISTAIHKTIVTGTPGIGKSIFLIYFLWTLVKGRQRVLFIYHPDIIYFDGKGGVFELEMIPPAAEHSFWADLWCLFDAKHKSEFYLDRLPYNRLMFVLSTSPRRNMINDFKKPPCPQTFVMPIWTQSELQMIASKFPNVTDWYERFQILGGVPRHVLEEGGINPIKMITDACNQCTLDDCISAISLNSILTERNKVIHILVHINSTQPFTESSVSYASQKVMDIIAATYQLKAKHKMKTLLSSFSGNPLVASLCGYIFESHAIEKLEKGGNFEYHQLVHGNSNVTPDEDILIIPASTRSVVYKVEFGQTQNQLFVPKSKNYTAIDAWIPGIGAFQMTVSKKHRINADVKKDLALLGNVGNKLYWLVPPLHYRTFTKQTPKDIDQYVVKIPYPTSYEEMNE
jgi:hypothetical protein